MHRSTGETDRGAALVAAARIYEEVTSRDQVVASSARAPELRVLLGAWLSAFAATHSEETVEAYQSYARAHWLPRFKSLNAITSATLADYQRARLRLVVAGTVRKELSAMRGFLAWCVERHVLTEAPVVPSVPKRAVGVPSALVGRQVPVHLTAEQMRELLHHLPEVGRNGHRVRALYTLAWETGLRMGTLERLEVPRHFRRGHATLTITADIDKARWGRELPLSDLARKTLDAIAPKEGLILGPVNVRATLKKAAIAAKIPMAAHVSDHDFRRAAATHLATRSKDLLGPQYLLGWKHISTAAKYTHARIENAAEALRAAAGTPAGTPKRKTSKPTKKAKPKSPRRKA